MPSIQGSLNRETPCVMIESPYAADDFAQAQLQEAYLQECINDSMSRKEAPFASHGFYTQYLDDTDEYERALGMSCGRRWADRADTVAFYTDLGMSPGMIEMLEYLLKSKNAGFGPAIVLRKLPAETFSSLVPEKG